MTEPDTSSAQRKLLQLDLRQILRSRIKGWKRWLIPTPVVHMLERIIRQDELNRLLRATFPAQGSDFSDALLRQLDISLQINGLENIPDSGRILFAGNHPLGGLDGIALIKVLGKRFGDENVRFLVNDMLMNVEPLRTVFLPVNKYGAQGRGAARAINEEFAGPRHLLVFPAGLVSRLHDDGSVSDLIWQKSFVAKAMEFNRMIIPVRFEALNSSRFYRLARLRKKLGIRFNIEQILLPAELCSKRGDTFRITFGKPISPETLRNSGKSPMDIASDIRRMVYNL